MGIVGTAPSWGATFGRWRTRLPVVRGLLRLDALTTASTLAPYVVVAVIAAITGFVLQNYLYRVEQDGLLVLSEPFGLPVYLGTLLLSVFQAASVTIAVAREREQGAMELLFYGPVDARAYLVAKLVTYVLVYLWLTVLVVSCDLLFTVVTGLRLSATVVWALVLSVGTAAAAISLALAVAAIVRRLRTAVLMVLGLAALSIGLQVLAEVMARLPTAEFHVSPVQVLRAAAFLLAAVTGWVLPFSYFDRGMGALLRGDTLAYLGTIAACGAYAVAMLGAAWIGLDRVGVRR